MSETKHTSGPWKAHVARHTADSPAFGFAIKAKGKKPAVTSAAVYQEHVLILSIPEGQYEVYEKAMPEECAQYFTPQEVEANAHLIAAAPDMLAALKKIAADYGGCHCDHTDENCCEKIGEFCPHCISEIAIAKAGTQ